MKKLLVCFMVSLFILAGCSSSGGKKVVCTVGEEGASTSLTFIANGDELAKLEQKLEYTYEALQMTKEEAKAAAKAIPQEEEEAGVVVENTFGDKSVTVKTKIDFSKLSKELIDQSGLPMNDNGKIIFADAVSTFEAQGFTCK